MTDGSYGCVFSPPVRCLGSLKIHDDTNIIGKVFKSVDGFVTEASIMRVVKEKIDPGQLFTIHVEDDCSIDKPTEEDMSTGSTKEVSQQCLQITSQSKQLVYKHGGIDLRKCFIGTKTPESTFIQWFLTLGPIFHGLKMVNDNGYAHMDIKPANLLYSRKHKSTRLVDFGIMTKFDHIYGLPNPMFESVYMYFPLELKTYHAAINNRLPTRKQLITHYKESFTDSGIDIFKSMQGLGIDTEKEIELFIAKVYSGIQHNVLLPRMFTSWVNKIDIYGMGMTLLQVMTSIGIFPYGNTNTNGVARIHLLKLRGVGELITGMVHPNPDIRWGLDHVISTYDALAQIM